MTKDHGLSDGQHAVDVGNGAIFLFLGVAHDVVLLDVVQRLLLPVKPLEKKFNIERAGPKKEIKLLEDHGIPNDHFGEFHDIVVIGGREQHHLTGFR